MAVKARADAALTSVSDGATGAKGDAGASVTSVTTFWQLAASQPATPSGTADPSGWGKTIPTVPEGYTGSLWVTYRNVISDGSTPVATWTTPAKDSSYEYAQRCWQLDGGTYTTARALKASTDEVSSTLSKEYTTTEGMASAIGSAVAQTASDLTAEFTAMVGDVSGANMMRGSAAWSALTGGKWEDGAVRVTGSATVTSCSEAAPAGAAGCAVTLVTPKADGTQGGFCQDAYPSVEAGQAYTLSCWVKASKAGAAFKVQVMWWSDISSGYSKDVTLGAAGAWQRVTHTFTPTAGATGVSIGYFMGATACDYWVAGCKVERGGVATAWDAGVQDTSTLIRQSGDGVEVARKSGGAYTGTRAVLGSDALEFRSADGKTEIASFGADPKGTGVSMLGGVASMMASDKTVTVSDKEQATLTGLDIAAPFTNVSGGDYLATVGTSSTVGGYSVSAQLKTGLISGYYGQAAHSAALGAYKTKTGEQHSSELMLTSTAGATVTCVDGKSSNTLGVTAEGVRGGGKALWASSQALATGVTAYRHMGWVVVAFNNYVLSTVEVTKATHFTVGTLPDGWKPPAMMKGQLYAGTAELSAMVYVRSEAGAANDGQVCVYTNYMLANQTVSGYVVYPATR